MTIAEMNRRWQKVDVKTESVNIIIDSQPELIKKNQEQLHEKGQDKNNVSLKSYHSPFYAAEKLKLNPAGVTDLKLTGALYGGMYLNISSTSFKIGSSDEKEGDLERKYGKDIWGLSKENLSEFAKGTFYDKLKAYITGKTGLKFS